MGRPQHDVRELPEILAPPASELHRLAYMEPDLQTALCGTITQALERWKVPIAGHDAPPHMGDGLRQRRARASRDQTLQAWSYAADGKACR